MNVAIGANSPGRDRIPAGQVTTGLSIGEFRISCFSCNTNV